jgi:hypothetical protein
VQLLRNCSEVDPHVFVTPVRLDLAVKVRFFRHLLNHNDPDAERVYRQHIEQRTGGVEKRSWKKSVDDYVNGAEGLLLDMWTGFNPKHPVELGSNLNLMGGAHRIACAIAKGFKVHREIRDKAGNARAWDIMFLHEKGMRPSDIRCIQAYQEELEHEARRRIG